MNKLYTGVVTNIPTLDEVDNSNVLQFPSQCKRVQARIECLQCEYPGSESMYMLRDDGTAIEPFSKNVVDDPGCNLHR